MKRYRTILIDPPWPVKLLGSRRDSRYGLKTDLWKPLPYRTLTINQIESLPVGDIAEVGCHLWLWTTNQYLETGFKLMRVWGFRYLAPITWVKPSGMGHWFIARTQTLLFGYKQRCRFRRARYEPSVFFSGNPKRHSAKPECSYQLIERVSDPARLELFARERRKGWDVWGDEAPGCMQHPLLKSFA